MFVGHYGPAYAIKRWYPDVPIFVLFIAVQLIDVLWAVLVLLGIERLRIVPGITATNPFDLYYMPYTHSLVAAVIWSVIGGLVYLALRGPRRSLRVTIAVGLAVFLHWLLDLLVHRPDLALYDNTAKVGFGLWNFPIIAMALEIGSVLVGLVLYLTATRARDRIGRFGPWAFVGLLVIVQSFAFFGNPPETSNQVAVTAFASYFIFAGLAGWLDGHRGRLRAA